MRLLYFKLRHDGPYKVSDRRKNNEVPNEQRKKKATSRMLIVAYKMRFWRFDAEDGTRGGGDNLLVLMTVHFHNMTAKKQLEKGLSLIHI